MRALLLVAIAVALCGAASAQHADPDQQRSPRINALEDASNDAAAECAEINKDLHFSLEEMINKCQSEAAEVRAALAANPGASGHSKNIAHVGLSYIEFTIAGDYVRADKTRSARACARAEAAWEATTHIDAAASPKDWASTFAEIRGSISDTVRICRTDFGVPAGAPSL